MNYSSPLAANHINLNTRILEAYTGPILTSLWREGRRRQHRSSAVADVHCLQAISKRVHYGKFVAESNCARSGASFPAPIASGDRVALAGAVTDAAIEQGVLRASSGSAGTYAGALGPEAGPPVRVAALVDVCTGVDHPPQQGVQVAYLRGGTWGFRVTQVGQVSVASLQGTSSHPQRRASRGGGQQDTSQ